MWQRAVERAVLSVGHEQRVRFQRRVYEAHTLMHDIAPSEITCIATGVGLKKAGRSVYIVLFFFDRYILCTYFDIAFYFQNGPSLRLL